MKLVALLTSAFCLLPSALPQEPPQSAPTPASASMPASEEFIRAVFIGKRFADMKDYEAAFRQFAKADALQPDQPQVLYNMAVLLAKAGRYSDSQAKVDR